MCYNQFKELTLNFNHMKKTFFFGAVLIALCLFAVAASTATALTNAPQNTTASAVKSSEPPGVAITISEPNLPASLPPAPTKVAPAMSVQTLVNWSATFTGEKGQTKSGGQVPVATVMTAETQTAVAQMPTAVANELKTKIASLEVKPTIVFGSAISGGEASGAVPATSMTIAPKIEENKIIYEVNLVAGPMPTLNVATSKPVVFNVGGGKTEVAGEQVIDVHKIVEAARTEAQLPKFSIQLQETSVSAPTLATVVVNNGKADITFPISASGGGVSSKSVEVNSNFTVAQEGMSLTEKDVTYPVQTVPTAFYEKTRVVLASNKLNEDNIATMTLGVENQKAVYKITITEPAKLFGLIPIKLSTKLVVPAATNKIEQIQRPWYSFLATKTSLSKDTQL